MVELHIISIGIVLDVGREEDNAVEERSPVCELHFKHAQRIDIVHLKDGKVLPRLVYRLCRLLCSRDYIPQTVIAARDISDVIRLGLYLQDEHV